MPLETVAERRAAYMGSVGAGFNVQRLMTGALDDDTSRYIRFALYDAGPAPTGEKTTRFLFHGGHTGNDGPARGGSPHAEFSRVLPLEVGGRLWEIHFKASKKDVVDLVDELLPWVVLIGGLFSSVLLSSLFYSLASSRTRAETIAIEMTANLRENEANLAEAERMAHLGNWALDPASHAMTWSSETFRILGLLPDSRPRTFRDFLAHTHRDDRDYTERALVSAVETRQHREFEYRIVRLDGGIRWVHTIVQGNAPPPVPGTMMDITDRKLAEQELLESKALLSDAQKLAGVGCWQYSPADGRHIWSEELYRMYGVDPRSFTPTCESLVNLVHPDDRAAWRKSIADALREHGEFSSEFRIVRPDGKVRHLRCLGEVIADSSGRAARVLLATLDITEQKEVERTLRASTEQLTALSRGLVQVQETERRQLSRELHDRVGQNLTALSINLDILRATLTGADCAEQRARIDDSSRLLESTVDSIEDVMSELRPPMLDDYGLLPALQWYTKDFASRTGIEVAVVGADDPERLAPDIEITLFRVAQEALTNVAKHAHASRVEIALEHGPNHCTMTVGDNGIGIGSNAERRAHHRPRLGIVTMRERVQAIGGRFHVRSGARGGTQIAIEIP
jgi:signal transduction histidine kinase